MKHLFKKQFAATLFAATSMILVQPAFAKSADASPRAMTEVDLATLKRIGSPTVSPNGEYVVYQLRETDLTANKGRTDLYLVQLNIAEQEPVKIASKPEFNEHSPAFSSDGKLLYYISNEGGSDQLYYYDMDSQTSTQASNLATDIAGFKLAHKGDKIALWGDIGRECPTFGCKDDGNTATPGPGTGREYTQNFVRHWDSWETPGNYSRIFTFDMVDGKVSGDGVAMDGKGEGRLIGDAPSKPFGGGEEIAWTPSGNGVLFAARKADANEPLSTNLDIYGNNASTGEDLVNLTIDNEATDTMPISSPDGKWLAYAAMARAGYESDKLTLMLLNPVDGTRKALTENWDRSVGSIAWAPDSQSLLVTAGDTLEHPMFRVDLSGKVTRLTGDGNVNDVTPLTDGSILYSMNTVLMPSDLYIMDAAGKSRKITDVNAGQLAELNPVVQQKFDFAGANGDQVFGMIIKPANVKGPLPVAFVVHGGPQGSFGNSWSYRWNPRVIASQGYAVVTVDFHGSTGYGQAFTDSINKDWGGKPLEDLKLGLAAAGKIDPQADITNACALGASYGGYMMNWIAGNWNDGFKCLVTHAGVFDLRAMSMETEELWFDEWDHGGPWWSRTDAEKWNPVNHITKWKTPTLVIHGEKDFRIPYSQSLAAFTVLQRQGIESKLLIFPDENHWINKPNNSIQWHNNVFNWLDSHLKKAK
ncbi:peptidase S9 [Sphingorhabdus lutea]|uniref:Peptidase S9 n=1 Tax=Sphingorhabdus lutea TaxID=1913578 RepID=A0A1L3J9C4_9SPHN|nr:S9 family peptidase [Sphingorhabdus lutea]APG61724.1 peptidase S9 [Sphingorhabdus lutea]